jgi:hypothetical protein
MYIYIKMGIEYYTKQEYWDARNKKLGELQAARLKKLKEDWPKTIETLLTLENIFDGNITDQIKQFAEKENIPPNREEILKKLNLFPGFRDEKQMIDTFKAKPIKIKLTPITREEIFRKACIDSHKIDYGQNSPDYEKGYIYLVRKDFNHFPIKAKWQDVIDYNGKKYVVMNFARMDGDWGFKYDYDREYNNRLLYIFELDKYNLYKPFVPFSYFGDTKSAEFMNTPSAFPKTFLDILYPLPDYFELINRETDQNMKATDLDCKNYVKGGRKNRSSKRRGNRSYKRRGNRSYKRRGNKSRRL